MKVYGLFPLLTEEDPPASSEGALDPLGLYSIADALGVRLIPGVRERQSHPRFLTAMAVSTAVCSEFPEDTVASDGFSEPWQVFEWYLVEGLVRTADDGDDIVGLPGSQKVREALADKVRLSATRFLKTPRVFGFHGIYRLLARTLGIEENGRLGPDGYDLLMTWAKEESLDGFYGQAQAKEGDGQRVYQQLYEAVKDGLDAGAVDRSSQWGGWKFFKDHLGIYSAGKKESRLIGDLLMKRSEGRSEVLQFLVSDEGQEFWKEELGDQSLKQKERRYHGALLEREVGVETRAVLDAIMAYESFARLAQDAFDQCLHEMSKTRRKVPASVLALLPAVSLAAEKVPRNFGDVMAILQPVDLSYRFTSAFQAIGEATSSPEEWVVNLMEHHRKIQIRKPPNGKNPWLERFDDGSYMIRSGYLKHEHVDHGGDDYVHAYRTGSLWSFAADLGLVDA